MEPINFDVTAPDKMLDTERFNLRDNTVPLAGAIREIYIGGQLLSESQEEAFATGQHLFPLIGEDKIYNYRIKYIDPDETEYEYIGHVVVYTTKPKAQFKVTGTFKENRLIEANTDVTSVNSSYLFSNATIVTDFFNAQNLDGSSTIIKYGTQNATKLAYIVKDQASIQMQMKVTTSVPESKIQRSDIPSGYFTSDAYNYKLFILEDHAPALISNVWNATLVRNEVLNFYYDSASVDEDIISVSTYKIYYDNDGNGTPEFLIKQGNYADYTEFKPTQLGYYKIVFYAEETFGQPTLSQFITVSDKRTSTIEREFYVDNLSPMAKLYSDIEYDFPLSDVIVLNDEAITRDKNNSIVSERVNWINNLRQSGINASVQVWDLFTYIHSQSASTTKHTGSSYPSSSIPYSSGGYSGTLNRYNVVNNSYRQDDGRYVTITDSKTVSTSRSQSGTAPPTASSNLPSSISYSSGGYTGTMYQDSYDYSTSPVYEADGSISTWKFRWSRYATYSGTATKSSTVWESDYNWYDDYTGYYSGTVYKNVKQTFTPALRINADKYIVYFATNNINNLADLQAIKSKGTFKIILVGNALIKAQTTHDYFIDGSKALSEIIKEISTIVSTNNPYENKQTILVNETFNLSKADYDEEKDPLTDLGYEYVHDANFFDNSMGQEANTLTAYGNVFGSALKNSFSKVGHYAVYRKIVDSPVGKASFVKESNSPKVDIYVHRIPIADFSLNWDYDGISGTYLTTWVDKSYDLDHQFTDAQKGIRDRKIMYRKTSGDNIWVYAIPNNLTSGTYELKYTVKDIEGAWSNEATKIFTLASEPQMQFISELKAKNGGSLTKFAIGQDLVWYDSWSRFPYAHRLEVSLWDGASRVTAIPIKTVNYTAGVTATKVGNDYTWNDITFNLPKGIGLQAKMYTVRIEAISNSNPTNKVAINRNVTLVNNTIPSVSTSISPTVIYEGDKVVLNIIADDLDKENLTASVYILKNETMQSFYSKALNPAAGVYPVLKETIFNKIPYSIGDVYRIVTVVKDASGEIVDGVNRVSVSFSVNPLKVDGFVTHTPDWDSNRAIFNTANPSYTRNASVFWSGEKFILSATTTSITAPSVVNATSVLVKISGTTYQTYLTKAGNNWTGSLWDKSMINKWGRPTPEKLTFIFEATYSNGTVKQDAVDITVDDTLKYWELHRKF